MRMLKNSAKARQHTRAFSCSKTGQKECSLEEVATLPRISEHISANTVVVVENISLPWANAIADGWNMEWSFFKTHAVNPQGDPSTWDAIFGPTLWERPGRPEPLTPPQHKDKLHGKETSSHDCSWHADGIFRYVASSSASTSQLTDPNSMPRLLEYSSKYGWQASSRISCYVKQNSVSRTYLILVDAPMTWLPHSQFDGQHIAYLHLPLALNRGGLVLPDLFGSESTSLGGILQQFLSHAWHLNVLFSTEMLSAESFFHLVVASTWEQNLRFLDTSIKRIAFKDIRRPNSLINDQLHDLREKLVSLRDSVLVTKKWAPPSVNSELSSIASLTISKGTTKPSYIGYPEHTLHDILVRAESLEGFLMDSFKLFVSSTSLMHAELSVEQAKRSQRLTQLAFLYIPLSFVTGIFGMNIKEINHSPLSVWVPLSTLAVTALCTAIVFFVASRWERSIGRPLPSK